MSKKQVSPFSLAATITPSRLASLVYELEPQQHEANRGSVAIEQLIDELLKREGIDLASRARFEIPLKKAILRAVEQIPDMEFIDGG